jgi:hypothetical protein
MHVVEWVILAVVVFGIIVALFGWDRYRGSQKSPGGTSQPTNEVFIDPTSGQRMRVWYNQATGRREYHPEQFGQPADRQGQDDQAQ